MAGKSAGVDVAAHNAAVDTDALLEVLEKFVRGEQRADFRMAFLSRINAVVLARTEAERARLAEQVKVYEQATEDLAADAERQKQLGYTEGVSLGRAEAETLKDELDQMATVGRSFMTLARAVHEEWGMERD